jgi:S-adenosylhomocysteine hydrolase
VNGQSRSATTRFRGSADEAAQLLGFVMRALDVPSTVFTESPTTTVAAMPSGNLAIAVGPAPDPIDAAGGVHELSAVRLDVDDNDWVQAAEAVARLPFTRTELDGIASTMPLTVELPGRVGDRPLSGFSAVCTIHHMTDFVMMIEAGLALGLKPADVTVIDKEYRYELTHRVDATLREMGVVVERYSDLSAALGRHLARARARNQRTVVLDDGGYVFPVLYREFHQSLQDIVGVIEQTTSGIWRLRPYDVLPVPVFSVAESRLKATIESYGVTNAAFRNTLNLLPNLMLEGRPAVVVGLGRLGAELAPLLRDRRMRVTAYDSDPLAMVELAQRGIATTSDLVGIIRDEKPIIIFGCTGGRDRPSLTNEHFEALARDCYLVSLTSRDYEFDLAALQTLAIKRESRGRVGTTYTLHTGVAVTVVADGFPINFHYAESMPNQLSDLVLASMLVGACTLVNPSSGFIAGHNVPATNRVLDECGILERFRRLYHS